MAWIVLHIVVECKGRRYVCVFGNLLGGYGRPGSRYHFDVWRYIAQVDLRAAQDVPPQTKGAPA